MLSRFGWYFFGKDGTGKGIYEADLENNLYAHLEIEGIGKYPNRGFKISVGRGFTMVMSEALPLENQEPKEAMSAANVWLSMLGYKPKETK